MATSVDTFGAEFEKTIALFAGQVRVLPGTRTDFQYRFRVPELNRNDLENS